VAGVGTFQSLILQVGGLTCRWQRLSVKTFLLRILNDSWAGHNPQGLQCRLKKKKLYVIGIVTYLRIFCVNLTHTAAVEDVSVCVLYRSISTSD